MDVANVGWSWSLARSLLNLSIQNIWEDWSIKIRKNRP